MPKDVSQTPEAAQSAGAKPVRRVSRRAKPRPHTSAAAADKPTRLKLVGVGAPDVKPPMANPTPIAGATDPRWVLAVSAAQLMEGDVLPPHKRETLMSQGKAMGLSPFDCSLILATIQDRARRGIALDECPAASETQLALIPLPTVRPLKSALGEHPSRTLLIAGGLLALQAMLIWAWLG
ncbi:MAG: hypothetical protein AAF085_03305 [Planctomycetota bacterium]